MARNKSRAEDKDLRRVRGVLDEYAAAHRAARVDVQRQNSVSIRIRVVDPDFEGMDRVQRDDALWKLLEPLPEDVQSQITMLLLLTPKEAKTSWAYLEFENPVPSKL